MEWWARWRRWARTLRIEATALYLAARHPRTPWYARLAAAAVAAYAFSPLDLIPDFIPVLGHLDDALLLPLGIALVLRLIPDDVRRECREAAQRRADRPRSWIAALVIAALWVGAVALTVAWLSRRGVPGGVAR